MPKSIYESIYKDLKQRIESNEFAYRELLPSENTLIHTYDCSRNTVRRAISRLVTDGYVQTMQGKGVRNIYRPVGKTAFTIGEIESFRDPLFETDSLTAPKSCFLWSFVRTKPWPPRQGFLWGLISIISRDFIFWMKSP